MIEIEPGVDNTVTQHMFDQLIGQLKKATTFAEFSDILDITLRAWGYDAHDISDDYDLAELVKDKISERDALELSIFKWKLVEADVHAGEHLSLDATTCFNCIRNAGECGRCSIGQYTIELNELHEHEDICDRYTLCAWTPFAANPDKDSSTREVEYLREVLRKLDESER